MLVLSRKIGETISIGTHITVTVLEVKGNRIRVGIAAPETVKVLRGELSPNDQPLWQPAPAELPTTTVAPQTDMH